MSYLCDDLDHKTVQEAWQQAGEYVGEISPLAGPLPECIAEKSLCSVQVSFPECSVCSLEQCPIREFPKTVRFEMFDKPWII